MSYTVQFRNVGMGSGTSFPNIRLPQGMDVVNRQDIVPDPMGGAYANGPDVGEVQRLVFEHWIMGETAEMSEGLAVELAGAFGSDAAGLIEEITVTLANSTGRIYRGRPAGVTFRPDRLGRQGIMEARCEFATFDPIWYSPIVKIANVSMPVAGDGITVASGGITVASGGITVVGGNVAGDANVLNAGTAAVDWSVRLIGPITAPRVTVAGGIISLTGDLPAGSALTLDSRTRTVQVDNVYQTLIVPGAQWRKLPSRLVTTFSLRGDAGTGTGIISWRDGNR